ncbi:hypothetical protein ACF3DV_30015 [Chlorogloeopsis fritschii PCC 9212]|nr:hypothetical protein [Chlorogloeopsis fritschii]
MIASISLTGFGEMRLAETICFAIALDRASSKTTAGLPCTFFRFVSIS